MLECVKHLLLLSKEGHETVGEQLLRLENNKMWSLLVDRVKCRFSLANGEEMKEGKKGRRKLSFIP